MVQNVIKLLYETTLKTVAEKQEGELHRTNDGRTQTGNHLGNKRRGVISGTQL